MFFVEGKMRRVKVTFFEVLFVAPLNSLLFWLGFEDSPFFVYHEYEFVDPCNVCGKEEKCDCLEREYILYKIEVTRQEFIKMMKAKKPVNDLCDLCEFGFIVNHFLGESNEGTKADKEISFDIREIVDRVLTSPEFNRRIREYLPESLRED